jgi:galacturonokinase
MQLAHAAAARYGVARASVRVVYAPYRICPLGAHIDHQGGPVTAMAVARGVLLAYAPSRGTEVELASLDFPGEVRFALDAVGEARPGDWGNYARGAARALAQAGYALKRDFLGMVAGPWSEGGLSSSAAVGVAYLLALEDVNGLSLRPEANIWLDQAIENGYLGLNNGILDPAAILLSRRGQLTVIDCATAGHELVRPPPAMPSWRIMLAFSGLKRALVGTDYNRRVAECVAAARLLLRAAGRGSQKPLLGQVAAAEHAAHRDKLPAALARRAAHFFAEVERVHQGVDAWNRGALREFGRLMTASGQSSIQNYECGSEPLIELYRILAGCEGVYGARFSGAGFRGCCVAFVAAAAAEQVKEEVQRAYARCQPSFAAQAPVAVCSPDDGARWLDLGLGGSASSPHGLPADRAE